ncbi:ComEC/Rec2 family competence protein [Pseudalkalibacillus hwajinpoensis]|uniref:ComEC/Rec2 family competence protein n=1 Tax=Guptibacillus hwajinpoensis TaxID=208199 RepID=UPI00325B6948
MKIQQLRQQILTDIIEEYPQDLQGIAASLLIGDRSLLPSDIEEAYQDLGLSHVLAVSGLHVGVIGGLLFWLLIRSGIPRERTYAFLFVFYPFYMVMTGCTPLVMRASLMAMAVVTSLRFRLNIHPLDGISSACILILLINPYYAFHIGFQLSFLIAFALIVSSQVILKQYKTPFAQLVSLSTLAQIALFPAVIYHFHQISILSLPLNLIYVPIVSVFILPLVLTLALMKMLSIGIFFDIIAAFLSHLISFFHDAFITIMNLNLRT